MITLLNHVKNNGFEVRLVTGGYDSGTWRRDREKLQRTNLDHEIIANVGGKENIRANTYSNVVAIIDDSREKYIEEVFKENPEGKHFNPEDIEELTSYLVRRKSQNAGISSP
jgi:CMP-2-keto-3-deoxyoctulosonic acid synthetase